MRFPDPKTDLGRALVLVFILPVLVFWLVSNALKQPPTTY